MPDFLQRGDIEDNYDTRTCNPRSSSCGRGRGNPGVTRAGPVHERISATEALMRPWCLVRQAKQVSHSESNRLHGAPPSSDYRAIISCMPESCPTPGCVCWTSFALVALQSSPLSWTNPRSICCCKLLSGLRTGVILRHRS